LGDFGEKFELFIDINMLLGYFRDNLSVIFRQRGVIAMTKLADIGTIRPEFTKKSQRAQDIDDRLGEFYLELADSVRKAIDEKGRTWTSFANAIPVSRPRLTAPGFYYLGDMPGDTVFLEQLEKRLKEDFPRVDHIRRQAGDIVIDTKRNTFWRRVVSGPSESYGGG
jgi:hypothetical protein